MTDGQRFMDILEAMPLVLCFDGQFNQVDAIINSLLPKHEDRVRFHKWAAACSLIQQPNDTGRCHKYWHAYFSGSRFKYDDISPEDEDKTLLPLKKHMTDAGMEPASVSIFYKFMQHADDSVDQIFTLRNNKTGWRIAGLYPRNLRKIMTGWIGWEGLEESQKIRVLAVITELEEHFDSHHYIDDQIIVDKLGDIIQFADKTTGKKRIDMALNRQRSMQISQKWVDQNRARKEREEEEKKAKAAEEKKKKDEERRDKEIKRIEQLEQKKKEKEDAKAAAAAAAGSAPKPKRVVRQYCSNTVSCNRDKSTESAEAKVDWVNCKSCSARFCPACVEAGCHTKHDQARHPSS